MDFCVPWLDGPEPVLLDTEGQQNSVWLKFGQYYLTSSFLNSIFKEHI